MNTVISTLTNPQEFAGVDSEGNYKGIIIHGGSNLVLGRGLYTPHGVATTVSDDDLAQLENNVHFVQHQATGYLKVIKSEISDKKAEAIAEADLVEGDNSAPETEESIAEVPNQVNLKNRKEK